MEKVIIYSKRTAFFKVRNISGLRQNRIGFYQQEELGASVATVNASLAAGFFVLLGQAHDELKRKDRGYYYGNSSPFDLQPDGFDATL